LILCGAINTIIFIYILEGLSYISHPQGYIIVLSSITSSLILFAFGLLSFKGIVKSILPKPRLRVKREKREKEIEVPTTVRLSAIPMVRPLTDRFSDWVERDMAIAGIYESPQYFISTYLILSIILLIVLTPLSIYFAIKVNPIISFLMFVPLIALIIPKFNLILKKSERRDATKDELPFFCAYAMIYQAVGKTLPDALIKASRTNVFRQIAREGGIVNKHLMVGEDDITSLSKVARDHPNQGFRTLLLGYTSVLNSGGDLMRYLEDKLKDFIEEMKFRWNKYVEDASNIAEMILMILFIFPTLLMAGAFIMPGESIAIITMFTLFGIPILFTVMFMMVMSAQPKTHDKIQVPVIMPIVGGIASTIPLYLTGIVDRFTAIAVGLTVVAGVNGLYALKQLREISSIDNMLPRFLRDITEYRKMGYDLVSAIITTSEEVRYSKVLDKHLDYIATQLRLGRRMRDIIEEVEMRSMLEIIVFELLSVGIEEGEIKPSQLEMLIDFISAVNRVKRETRAKLRLTTIISFIAPLALIFTAYLIAGVMTYFTSTGIISVATNQAIGGMTGSSGFQFIQGAQLTSLMDNAKALIIVSSMGIGLLTGKISSLTAKDTTKLAIIMGVTVISLLFGDVITSMFMRMLMGGR
jgi:flagellar protein FlaJ